MHKPRQACGPLARQVHCLQRARGSSSVTRNALSRLAWLLRQGARRHPVLRGVQVEVVDPVADYVATLREVFDFALLRDFLARPDFSLMFDAMHAVTGAYAGPILVDALGAPASSILCAHQLPALCCDQTRHVAVPCRGCCWRGQVLAE